MQDEINEIIEFFRKEREKLLEEIRTQELPPANKLFKARVIYKNYEFDCWLAYNNVMPKEFFSMLEQLFIYAKPARNFINQWIKPPIKILQEAEFKKYIVYVGNIIAVARECKIYDYLISNDQAIRFISQENKQPVVVRIIQRKASYSNLLKKLMNRMPITHMKNVKKFQEIVKEVLEDKPDTIPAEIYRVDLANFTIKKETIDVE